jgi:hypothetical protein
MGPVVFWESSVYERFEVEGFRCFENLKLRDLARINLIAGVNNVGKTALLEAIFVDSGWHNPTVPLLPDIIRGISVMGFDFVKAIRTPWDSLFKDFDTTGNIVFRGNIKDAGVHELKMRVLRQSNELMKARDYLTRYAFTTSDERKIPEFRDRPFASESILALEAIYRSGDKDPRTYYVVLTPRLLQGGPIIFPNPPSPEYTAVFMGSRSRSLNEDVERFGKLEAEKKTELLLGTLQVIAPELSDLRVIVEGGTPLIHGDVGGARLMPLPLMGEGMTKLASVALAISAVRNGVVLIDEVENGIHYSTMKNVWRAIAKASREFNVQVFATTHSRECIVAAHEAMQESGDYDFRLHRLERVKKRVKAATLDRADLSSIIESGLEVR